MKAGLSKLATALTLPLLLAACSGTTALPSLSTGSVANTASATPAAAAPAPSNPTARAFQVGSTSARAVKCGFNFDPTRLKGQYLASEATVGTAAADMGKVEKSYDISFNGISRGIAEKADYCSEAKSKEIKADLTRHLAGDYEPRQKQQVANKDDGGFFDGFFDGDDAGDNGPKIGTNEWWEKQKEKMGQ